ncbi:MAG: NifU family protein [Crocinitomicaceae bacterium TMED114]|nr:MAG: NifU family protein [Crocinitomicaceae bacterium TMED114]
MGFRGSVSKGARYRVAPESAQGRARVKNVRLFDIRHMSTPTSVYAEMTPNPEVMKFVADRPLIDGNAQAEFTSKAECAGHSSLAEELFNFPFVIGVFISGAFVSVTKDDSLGWEMIAMQMREYIQQWLTEHPVAVEKVPPARAAAPPSPEAAPAAGEPVVALADSDIVPTEHDQAIADLLEEFVRPAVEADGGAIDFRAFIDGTVHVRLRGACAGCPSSTATLKDGIERLLTSKLDVVQSVVAST